MANREKQSEQLNGSNPKTNLKDEEHKLFVRKLSCETTEKELREYFSESDEIEKPILTLVD